MRYGLFTFNLHANDTYLVKELINTIHPILIKMPEYALVIEKAGSPGEHFHLIFKFNGDTSQKVKQKIENKATTLFIKNTLTKTMTKYEIAFDYRLIENTETDLAYSIGYIYKDGYDYKSCGFTAQYVTACIQHYHTTIRNKAKIDPTAGWKILNGKTAHAHIEAFAKKNNMTLDDPSLYTTMRENHFSFNQITWKSKKEIFEDIILSNQDQCDEFRVKLTKHTSEQDANLELGYHKNLMHQMIKDIKDIMDMNPHDDDLRMHLGNKIYQYENHLQPLCPH